MKRGLTDSVSGSYWASSRQANVFLLTRTPVLLSALANSANGSFLVFPTTSSTASGKITFTSLQLLITAVQVIGANEPIVSNYRVEKDAADRASHPKRSAENLPRKASIETTRCQTRRPSRTTFTARRWVWWKRP